MMTVICVLPLRKFLAVFFGDFLPAPILIYRHAKVNVSVLLITNLKYSYFSASFFPLVNYIFGRNQPFPYLLEFVFFLLLYMYIYSDVEKIGQIPAFHSSGGYT